MYMSKLSIMYMLSIMVSTVFQVGTIILPIKNKELRTFIVIFLVPFIVNVSEYQVYTTAITTLCYYCNQLIESA